MGSALALRARGALGLRGRIIGVVLITAVVTLAVAAVTLLGPLENSLRRADQRTLSHALRKDPTREFRDLPFQELPSANRAFKRRLVHDEETLGHRIGGMVTVLGFPWRNGENAVVLPPHGEASSNASAIARDPFDDVVLAFRRDRPVSSIRTFGKEEYARTAIPFTSHGERYVLAVRKPIGEIPDVVKAVRRAFLDAALAGLVLTLLLGIPLSGRLVRRLRRLREAAIEAEHDSSEAVVPVDLARDEVGDLARSLAAMQQRLRGQEQARRSFVATASHELRTPLTSLDGMLELLDEDLLEPEPDLADARELLARARNQSRRLGRLAADLLDLSRIDAQVELRSEAVELSELGRAVLAEFDLVGTERHIQATLEPTDGAVWALGDPGSIARILRILLDNAQRASPPDAEIQVRLRRGDGVAISVSDEGPGVPAEHRQAIFERFNRGRETAGTGGFGLGLAIGRELAQRMGGALVLEPSRDLGATFTLRLLPARQPQVERVPVA